MRLQALKVHEASSCGGLLDGLEVSFTTDSDNTNEDIKTHCLLGPNGSGKSQFLQLVAEIFQSAWHLHSPHEEREASDKRTAFELEYMISPAGKGSVERVRLSRAKSNKAADIEMHKHGQDNQWIGVPSHSQDFGDRLPALVVGYTSGDNETLSLPFFVSRSGYSADVREAALKKPPSSHQEKVADNRLLLIDYSTHLEVLVANLLLGSEAVQTAIIGHAQLDSLASFRCIVQLNHLTRLKTRVRGPGLRKGVQLTGELEEYIDALKRCSTCWSYDSRKETYIFDVLVDAETRTAFADFFDSSIKIYRAFHKLALLNDLAIPKAARDRLEQEIETRRFASRLPEPQEEEKVFRFEQVRFYRGLPSDDREPLDYVSLSDGEHQQAQIFGVFSMITEANALFILDEPESHFNPQWRVQFVKRLVELPVSRTGSQEVILTSHAPFVPSDISREHVHIFSKGGSGGVAVRKPDIETYGATFDRILEHCFDVRPPISQLARDKISELMASNDVEELQDAMNKLGSSVEKAFLADRLRQLRQGKS
ncbi:restriction system-associated AAA family ATPase [Bradyrhizobium sp. PRIMUS42]|uniref:restriction system-associated AAA family ATPase n=1 Tax=Bradyrhizobium sp. PRIMUS42 TaxID=2908926 RepID=UPI001FF46410|nr:restriction system-associated AAA family ATPase [Bradyrhizobium sp. PRIMUS42]MCJ9732819.1 restriction system-associated AAA family ATPase [Bradyrhizobium sp. PRIMUS42]